MIWGFPAFRMNGEVPEVRGPVWWDAEQKWRAVTTSRERLLDRMQHRRT